MLRVLRTATLTAIVIAGSVGEAVAQSEILGWGRQVFDSRWNHEAFVEVAAGQLHTIARRSNGSIEVWGNNSQRECIPPALPVGVSYVEISAGMGYCAARLSDGSATAWGRNAEGQCNVPALPAGLSFVEIAAGDSHNVARRSNGSVVAWGLNSSGQCSVPALPAGLSYVEVAAGGSHSMARRSDGSLVAWGLNSNGQCNVPALPGGLVYVALAAGGEHSVARFSDGSVVAWGRNDFGQCNVPALPAGISYSEVTAGANHTVALRSDGMLVAWGRNDFGQCNVPVLPFGFSVVEIAAADDFTAMRLNGSCGTPPAAYCTAKVNSLGCLPAIHFSGMPSASFGSGFVIQGSNVRNQKGGLLLYTLGGQAAIPFQGGTLCVAAPIRRAPGVNSGGSPLPVSDCTGIYSLDFNAFAVGSLGGNPHLARQAPGTAVDAQWWGRDPGFPVPSHSTLTDGLHFTMCF
ncbi:MAG TPA: hypothetical protein VK843_12975 [Planctomycetota bacterium]|nr:hypothetical protein [Planctomycetota bacterium]